MNAKELKEAFENGTINAEEYIAGLQAENDQLKAEKVAGGKLRFKVSDKGGMSVYGMGRFPFTMYKEQWLRILSHAQEIIDFLKANDHLLTNKADKKPEPKAEPKAA